MRGKREKKKRKNRSNYRNNFREGTTYATLGSQRPTNCAQQPFSYAVLRKPKGGTTQHEARTQLAVYCFLFRRDSIYAVNDQLRVTRQRNLISMLVGKFEFWSLFVSSVWSVFEARFAYLGHESGKGVR